MEILNQKVYKGHQLFQCDNHTLNCRSEITTDNLIESTKEEKFYHDRYKSVSEKPIIPEGQNIWYRNHVKNIWEKGTVVDRDDISGRSYTLVGENGKILSQNCIDLKLCHTNVSHRNLAAKLSPPISNIPNVVKSTTLSSTCAKKSNINKSVTVARFGHTMKPSNRFKY